MALIQSVADDEIAAEFAASLPEDERRAFLEVVRGAPPHESESDGADGDAPIDRRRASDPRDLREATERIRPSSMAHERTLPLAPALEELFPSGLVRGASVSVADHEAVASGATSLALALAASASQAGSWVAIVGLPALGLAAAAELGLALERVAVITMPPVESWAPVLGALVGAFDLVLFGAPGRVKPAEVRRLMARARERGSVLVHVDTDAGAGAGARAEPEPSSASAASSASARSVRRVLDADVRMQIVASRWQGLGAGHGHLRGRQVTVEVDGRRQAARPRRHDLWLLDPDGRLDTVAVSVPAPMPVPVPVVSPAIESFAGADIDDLVAARRQRVRRVATEALPPPNSPVPAADAG